MLVTGATGRIGRHLVKALATKDVHIQAMTRRPERASELTEQGTTLVKAHFSDLSSRQILRRYPGTDLLIELFWEIAPLQTQSLHTHTISFPTEQGLGQRAYRSGN